MRLLYTLLLLLLIASGPSLAAQSAKKKVHPHKKAHKAEAIAEPTIDKLVDAIPAPIQPPPTPEQGPSSPPEVSYQGGQLVIVAQNSTMGDVLNAVKQKTGASVEMPAASGERVAGRFGPGAPRDVMAQLLNGSHYDYVLMGSPADPGALKKVVLMARVSGPQQTNPSQPQQPGRQNPAFQNPNYQENQNLQAVPEVENDQPVEENNADTSQDVPPPEEEQPSPEQAQPGQPPAVKTPEQLLRELQQQQQQQQQEQNGQPTPPPQ